MIQPPPLEPPVWSQPIPHGSDPADVSKGSCSSKEARQSCSVSPVKGDAAGTNHWVIKEGDATSGVLMTPFDGQRPSAHYNPMRKEGAIGLGTGGDNSAGATGNWFEGVMTSHFSSDAADMAVAADIGSVYGQ